MHSAEPVAAIELLGRTQRAVVAIGREHADPRLADGDVVDIREDIEIILGDDHVVFHEDGNRILHLSERPFLGAINVAGNPQVGLGVEHHAAWHDCPEGPFGRVYIRVGRLALPGEPIDRPILEQQHRPAHAGVIGRRDQGGQGLGEIGGPIERHDANGRFPEAHAPSGRRRGGRACSGDGHRCGGEGRINMRIGARLGVSNVQATGANFPRRVTAHTGQTPISRSRACPEKSSRAYRESLLRASNFGVVLSEFRRAARRPLGAPGHAVLLRDAIAGFRTAADRTCGRARRRTARRSRRTT